MLGVAAQGQADQQTRCGQLPEVYCAAGHYNGCANSPQCGWPALDVAATCKRSVQGHSSGYCHPPVFLE